MNTPRVKRTLQRYFNATMFILTLMHNEQSINILHKNKNANIPFIHIPLEFKINKHY